MNKYKIYLICFVITLMIFEVIYGLKIIIPTNINWLMSAYHDWGTHYLGWQFYRNEPFEFPLGNINDLYYPVGTNVGFTDSAPLLALIFKLFSPYLPDNFQYFGVLLLFCHLLVSYYTIRLLRVFKVNDLFTVFAVILMTTNPVLVFRGIHPTLCTQFLILASFYNYFKITNKENSKRTNFNQIFIFFLAVSFNPYMAAMIIGFNFALSIKNYYFDKAITFFEMILYPVVSIILGLCFWYVFGMLNLSKSSSINLGSTDNFRLYSFNLNSFFNSYGYFSKIIPDLGMVVDKQYEGYAYLGFGMILLVSIVSVYLTFRIKMYNFKKIVPLLIIIFTLFLFSLSCQITFGKKNLFEFPIPNLVEKIGFIFRASGRFVWPLYYLIFIFSLILFYKLKINKTLKTIILFLIVVIQIYDIQVLLTKNNLPSGDYHTKLSDNKWISIFKKFDKIITYPTFQTTLGYNLDYQDFCFLALKAKKPITNGYVARENVVKTQQVKLEINDRINNGIIEKELYVTTENNLGDFNSLITSNKVSVQKIDNFILIYSKGININNFFKNELDNKAVESLLEALKKDNQMTESLKKYIDSHNIEYNFDQCSFANDYASILGWAIVKNTQNATGDSIFITVSNEKQTYVLKPKLFKRPDVTTYLKRGNLDDSGFKVTLFNKNFLKGTYDIGVLIKDKKGVEYYSKTDKKITGEK